MHDSRQSRMFSSSSPAGRRPGDRPVKLSLSRRPVFPFDGRRPLRDREPADSGSPRRDQRQLSPRRSGLGLKSTSPTRCPVANIFVTTIYWADLHRVCGRYLFAFALGTTRHVTPRLFDL